MIAQTTLSARSACRTLRRGLKTTSQHSTGKRTVAGQKPSAPASPGGEGAQGFRVCGREAARARARGDAMSR
jgi:hypothetical protein